MPKDQTLVDYIVDTAQHSKTPIDTSIARRMIVEGRVRVNGDTITDPAFRLTSDQGFIVEY
jgi:hypothetical protein